MIKHFLYVLLTTLFFAANAQSFKISNLYKAQGQQGALNSIVDKSGSRYTLVIYDSDFTIDSVGTLITIHNNYNITSGLTTNAIAIIKYDASGKYLFHYEINTASINYNSEILTDIDENNNLVIAYTIVGQKIPSQILDSIDLIDSKKILYKRIYIPVNQDRTGIIISKIDSNGNFLWANSITRWRHLSTDSISTWATYTGVFGVTRECKSITHNTSNDVFINLDLYELQKPYHDTLTLIISNGTTIPIFVKQKDLMLKFSASGTLSYYIEPYKLKVNNSADYTSTLRSVSDGMNKYTLVRLTTPSPDTLIAPVVLPLDTGLHIVLIKTDNNDSIVWVKLIGRDTGYFARSYTTSSYVMSFNNSTQELALGFNFSPYSFKFSQPLNTSTATILIARLTTFGSFNHYSAYGNAQYLNSLSYNPLTNDLIAIGEGALMNLSIGKYNLQNLTFDYRYFIAYFNALDTCIGAKLIDVTGIGWHGNVPYNGFQDFGNLLTDKYGRTYLSGFYSKIINLPCQRDTALQYYDGFVLLVSPPPKAFDTNVCYIMLSPSGKHVWDSTGIYYDTIPNNLGCDSILLFNLKKLSTKSKIDSIVCGGMHSYSGKYYWQTSGLYNDTIPNSKNCDSIITVKLTVINSKTDSIKVISCKSYVSPSTKYTYNITGNYTDTIQAKTGCDSIIFINYIRLIDSSNIQVTTCRNYTSPSGKYTYTSSGKYIDTIQSKAGCDSIVFIYFFKLIDSSNIQITSCQNYLSPSGKFLYTISGNYIDTIQSSKGCDSIIHIKLTISKIVIGVNKSNDISCDTPFAQLKAYGALYYQWSPTQYLDNHLISNPVSSTQIPIIYTVVGSDSNGCKAFDSIEVNVNLNRKAIIIPNVFTPNNDGINDCFFNHHEIKFTELHLYIFNRWGNEVYSNKNTDGCWYGKESNGKDVSEGTYFYIIDGKDNCNIHFEAHGSLELLR
ncbi:MAG: gliding motility-associated C-terminal domain-containing protein [Bacteroidota bacterium]